MEKDPILEKYYNEGFGKNAFGWYFNPWIDEYDPDYDPHNDKEYNEAIEEKGKEEKKAEEDIKWHPDLTEEQIEELIAERIKPGDNEYDMYLWNHGIKPFDTEKVEEQDEQDDIKKESEDVIEEEPDDVIDHVIEPENDEEPKDVIEEQDKAEKEPEDVIDYVIEPEDKGKSDDVKKGHEDVIDYVIEPENEEEPELGKEDIKTDNSLEAKDEPFAKRIWNRIKNIFNKNRIKRIPEKSSVKIKRKFSKDVKRLLKSATLEEFNEKFLKIDKINLTKEEREAITQRMHFLKNEHDKEKEASHYVGYDPDYYKDNSKKKKHFTSKKLPRLRDIRRELVGGIKITGVKLWANVIGENSIKTNMKTNNLRDKYYADVDHNKAKEAVEKSKGTSRIDAAPVK